MSPSLNPAPLGRLYSKLCPDQLFIVEILPCEWHAYSICRPPCSLSAKYFRVPIRRHVAGYIRNSTPLCSLFSKFPCVPIRRHFAGFVLNCTPPCSLSWFYCTNSTLQFIFQILPSFNAAPLCWFHSKLYATLQFIFHILPGVNSAPLCRLKSKQHAALQFSLRIIMSFNSTPLCRLHSKLYATLQFIFQISPCKWLAAVYLPNFPDFQFRATLPVIF